MSNLSDLKALYITKAGSITFDVLKLQCLSDIDTWYNTRVACDSASSTDIQSYTIGGRTVTRSQALNMRKDADALEQKIMAQLYGTGGLAEERFGFEGGVY